MLATIVGSANGRSIKASTKPLPGKESRTSTQAITTPNTVFTTATTADTATVNNSAERAAGESTACQNRIGPPVDALATIADNGGSTISPSPPAATPSPSLPAPTVCPRRGGATARGGSTVSGPADIAADSGAVV